MKKQYGEYYLGLDIGTSSVGWAVTDENYKVQKFNGKSMWGVRLFEEAKTAEERRVFRSARRRNARETQRIRLLQELFAEEMAKIDPTFFIRMKDSKLLLEDKTEKQSNTLFNDKGYTDTEYMEDYPTIYHLRKELIENKGPHDIRLVYLAIHHILKHRGHFLYAGQFSDVMGIDISSMLDDLSVLIEETCSYNFNCSNGDEAKNILADQSIGVTTKKKRFSEVFEFGKEHDKKGKAIITLLSGGKTAISDIFGDEALKESDCDKISFSSSAMDDNEDALRSALNDRFDILLQLKAVYDWGILQQVLNGESYISISKVNLFEEHKRDLLMLKNAVREYCPEKFNSVFRDQKDKTSNYSAYIGNYRYKGTHRVIEKTTTQEEFCDFLRKKVFAGIEVDEERYLQLLTKLENGTLLPKQKTKDNSVIPHQIHEQELKNILDNAAIYLDFLNEKDERGLTVSDKILSIMTYRIPYYVGPVNGAHEKRDKGFYWAVKKSDEKVRPWNFEEVINLEASAEKFIRRMTNKCTYLIGEDVIPKDSLLYSRFMVLNELNNLRIDDEKISVQLKQQIFEEVFQKHKKITGKRLKEYLVTEGYPSDIKLTGFDQNFKSSLGAYHDFRQVLGKDVFTDSEIMMIEDVIKSIVLFGDDKKILMRKINADYGQLLTDEQKSKIKKLKYSGWGRFSKELLTEVVEIDQSTGEVGALSIISALYNYDGNPNFMELLGNDYGFSLGIEERNSGKKQRKDRLVYADLDELYVSVPVKRAIWQTVTICKEITKIMGRQPKKIFVEMARGPEENNKGRRDSRKDTLIALYKSCKIEERGLLAELEAKSDSDLRGDKLYLYYAQLGKCMYSGETIDLSDLAMGYDIDHIYPQSKVMDDSLDNRVLVKRQLNAQKSDNYPIDYAWQEKMKPFWSMLHAKGLISTKKFERLTRKTAFTEGEMVGFVSRQLVETRQSTKAVAHIFEEMYEQSEVVYVKAANVSKFRQGIDDFAKGRNRVEIDQRKKDNEFIKCRDVNDYHHAKDAYLNIVVGNVYHSKFTRNPANFFKQKDTQYSMNAMYKFPIIRDGVFAWEPSEPEKEGTMEIVRKMMNKNDILFTRLTREVKGGFFDQQIMKKGKGQVPLKATGAISCVDNYGGYNKASGAYFFLVEHILKGKTVRTLEFVPVYLATAIDDSKEKLLNYCLQELGLVEPRVLLEKIRMDALFELDGFRMHLSGRTGNSLVFKNANQLRLSYGDDAYIKRISKYVERCRLNKGREISLTTFDRITTEENIKLYDILADKMNSRPFATKFKGVADQLFEGRGQFVTLPIEEQVKTIMLILPLLQCNSVAANLKTLGGGEKIGILTLGKNIANVGVNLINQSPTGLFETRINLAEL